MLLLEVSVFSCILCLTKIGIQQMELKYGQYIKDITELLNIKDAEFVASAPNGEKDKIYLIKHLKRCKKKILKIHFFKRRLNNYIAVLIRNHAI